MGVELAGASFMHSRCLEERDTCSSMLKMDAIFAHDTSHNVNGASFVAKRTWSTRLQPNHNHCCQWPARQAQAGVTAVPHEGW